MELQEKEEDKDENYIGKLMRNIKGKSFLFTLDLKPITSIILQINNSRVYLHEERNC